MGELVVTVFVWRFVRALAETQPDARSRSLLSWCAWAVVACSVLTTARVLALAWVPHPGDTLTQRLAIATDLSDVLVFAVVAVFGYGCAGLGNPTWVRICGAGLATVSLARIVLDVLGHRVLDNWAAVGFLLVILAFSVRLIRR